jgi:hypothetical protein
MLKPVTSPIGSRSPRAVGAAIGMMCASIVLFPVQAANSANPGPANANAGIPPLMQEPGVSWMAYNFTGFPGVPKLPPRPANLPNRAANAPYDKQANEWLPPLEGIGPITDDPAHPFYNNPVAADLGVSPTYRVADLNNQAAKNLLPWALEALKKQNALVLANRNGETRQARCWETGVPDFQEAPWEMYFIQTPKEVTMIMGGAEEEVRHVYLDVPHSMNPKPSWFGESVGHYEGGDTLVVDTIGLNDRTFVDGYRTPHTTQLHVVERFKVTDGGKTLDVSFTADDPGTFYKPWSARRPRYREVAPYTERVCAINNDDVLNQGFDPVPTAVKLDF